jgi:hypothetical protein
MQTVQGGYILCEVVSNNHKTLQFSHLREETWERERQAEKMKAELDELRSKVPHEVRPSRVALKTPTCLHTYGNRLMGARF